MKQSGFLSLGWRDLLRGLALAIIAFILNWAQTTFVPSLNISAELKLMIITGIAYLAKNFFTPKDTGDKLYDEPIVGDRPTDR